MNELKSESSMYHIVFYPDPTSKVAHCVNLEAVNMLDAIQKFYQKFPNLEPLYVHHKK